MPLTHLPFRYVPGKTSNLAALIWSQDRTTIRTSGTTMTAIGSVADSVFAAGRLTATEKTTSSSTGTSVYALSTFPSLSAGFYIIEIYDVATPSNSSPGPIDVPLSSANGGVVYWDGSTLIDGVLTALFSTAALAQLDGIATPGAGADQCTITITGSDTMMPIPDADVWVTSDLAGSNVIWGTDQTDSNGQVTALLDAGITYHLFMQKDGEQSILGQSFVAVAD